MTQYKSMVSALFIAAFSATVVVAHDRNPPPWREGPLSVSAEWDFKMNTNPAQPERWEFFGHGQVELFDPEMHRATMGGGLVWQQDGSEDGRWYNPTNSIESIRFDVTNFVMANPEKRIRVQVTYEGDRPSFDPIYGWIGDQKIWAERQTKLDWDGYYYEDWTIKPNPHYEEFFLNIPAHTAIDQVVIDTQCIPAPATGFLGVMAMFLCAPRRRR